MRGHYEDTGYGTDRFIPYHESDDEAYERLMRTQDEDESEVSH